MKRNYQLVFLSAFLLWFAWPPIPFSSPILLIALVPILLATENIIGAQAKKKGKLIFRTAFLCFFAWNTASIYWVFNSLDSAMPTWVAALISLIPFGLGAVLMTFAFWLYYRLRLITSKVWSYAGLICFWIGYEYLHQSWDLAFPWMNLGNGFAATHQLVQWYEYTGVYGGTLWVLLSNILFFEIWQALKAGTLKMNKTRLILPTIILVTLPVLISLFIYFTHTEKSNPANIVVVQPNIDPYKKFGSMPPSEQINRLIHLSDSVGQSNTEYFIWPETAISQGTEEKTFREDESFKTIQNFLNEYKNANLISGIESFSIYDSAATVTARYNKNSGIYFDVFNAAVSIENSGTLQFYHKSKLVPGVEQTPFSNALSFLKPAFAAFGGATGSYGKQDEPSVFYSQSGIGSAPVICYESIWGEYVADYIKKDAQFIAIITNDGWWGNTSGKDQHLHYAKLRAIETRRWVARSANTGISAFINQRGDIVQRSKWWVQGALKQDINLNEELSFYVRFGDYIARGGSIGSGVFALILIIALLKKRKF
ncbi:MAG: apolipoprotein N-acyltransferase [Sphingobacteriales bacterium 17-39-43]|uniref:apolipoprotein N-acyltransferase n=1 Tax=Daejeonella sp. TaxID=2805397 RepID=UPI000BD990FB|nr:apolipoprotein N-acyltransferase [Daejeonella sp.]OYZ31108.1 MAG: apolipoprotein N-acyltransferase [Sphingobacteriales bacterium 16-39-50]OZA23949.1 MAG: apolipoprotein N-acyltransferase [Sphingobacteriales bacterium 17-39-43]HQT23297.1 apolipoprotein N-acyltransferase [Daejeonella sp.]HQT58249.1 apolipoprotein N-acyltransferase [Daejeonella sp.]